MIKHSYISKHNRAISHPTYSTANLLLSSFINFRVFYLSETDITPRDPRWIGAWWLGFLIFGI